MLGESFFSLLKKKTPLTKEGKTAKKNHFAKNEIFPPTATVFVGARHPCVHIAFLSTSSQGDDINNNNNNNNDNKNIILSSSNIIINSLVCQQFEK